jgi:hypothetical protein
VYGIESPDKFTLKVVVEDTTKPVDLNDFLSSIPDASVRRFGIASPFAA